MNGETFKEFIKLLCDESEATGGESCVETSSWNVSTLTWRGFGF